MAFNIFDRVKETSATTGTGNLTLAGAVSGFRTFASVYANNDTMYYCITDQSGANWEVGVGTFVSATPALARTSVLASSNANAAVNFTGATFVFVDLPAARTVVMNRVQAFTKQQNFALATLTDASNISWNLDDGQVAMVTIAGNRTLDNPTNIVAGGTYLIIVKQDGSGGHTLGYGNLFKWAGGTPPVVASGANDVSIISLVSDGTNLYGVAQLDFS